MFLVLFIYRIHTIYSLNITLLAFYHLSYIDNSYLYNLTYPPFL